MSIKEIDRQKQADELLEMAERNGVQSNYLFTTTFERYQVQLGILDKLEEAMKEDGMLVTKEYVKGRRNLYENPAVKAYNSTTDSANKTASTLIRLIKEFGIGQAEINEDPLLRIINGGDDK